ncbi:uncharacterized protein [Amphiura filiformis]|uniref:uncharacterized protein n=1 Tax=Amphiura filiformis TaxID=82378 RepID=UPI003B20C913
MACRQLFCRRFFQSHVSSNILAQHSGIANQQRPLSYIKFTSCRFQPSIFTGRNHNCRNQTHSVKQLSVINWSNQTHRSFHLHSCCCCQQIGDEKATTSVNSDTTKVDYTLRETVLNVMGAKYRVSYVDEGDKSDLVVLCLHGMPACHKDFLSILPALVNGGARVILLNFPGIGYSWHLEGPAFDYSHLTKAKLVEAFLSRLGINKVNMLVSHSSSGHSGMQLSANTDLIQGVTFICPIAHLPHGTSKRTFSRDVMYYLLKPPIMRAVLGPLILSVFRKVSKMPIPEVEYFYGLIVESKTWNWKQAEADLKTINAKAMPVMVLAAHRDPIVQLYISKGVMNLLGISQGNRLTYSKDNVWQPVEKGNVNPMKHGVIFEKSSHWIQKSHPDVVADLILNFLKAIKDHR